MEVSGEAVGEKRHQSSEANIKQPYWLISLVKYKPQVKSAKPWSPFFTLNIF